MAIDNLPKTSQAAQQKSIRHWFPHYLYILEVLICIPIFYCVNKFLLDYFFGWAKVEYADYELRTILVFILIETSYFGFLYYFSRCRWHRHCLNALLFFVILLAVAYIVVMQPAWKQKATVEAIKKWGDHIIVHTDSPDYSLDALNCKHYPTWLRDFVWRRLFL